MGLHAWPCLPPTKGLLPGQLWGTPALQIPPCLLRPGWPFTGAAQLGGGVWGRRTCVTSWGINAHVPEQRLQRFHPAQYAVEDAGQGGLDS